LRYTADEGSADIVSTPLPNRFGPAVRTSLAAGGDDRGVVAVGAHADTDRAFPAVRSAIGPTTRAPSGRG
jgi:hypothetical protein